jgi:SAM-dependent methyltransferase
MPSLVSTTTSTEIPAKKHLVEDTKFSGGLWLNPEIGNLYSRVERITGPFSIPLLHMTGLFELPKSITVLDLCCGTGVTSSYLQQLALEKGARDKVDLTCGDFSASQLAIVNKKIKDHKWDNAKAVQVNAMVSAKHGKLSKSVLD